MKMRSTRSAVRFISRVISGVLMLLTFSGAVLAQSGPDPQAVEEVLAGLRDEAYVTWWGFDPEDSTQYLQAAISSGAARVIIPNVGQNWVVRPITLRSNLELVLEEGVEVVAKKGAFKGKHESLFSAGDIENLKIIGHGATLRMHKDDYDNPDLYEKAEWRMGIAIRGSKNVEITGLTIRDTGGDGIYLGRGQQILTNENVTIRDLVADNNYRQGISVITARNLLIEDSIFKNTGGTPPAAGVDLEPNSPDEVLENIVIRNSVFDGNEGPGMHMYLRKLGKDSNVSVLWENVLVRGSTVGINVHLGNNVDPDDLPSGNITVRNCIVENSTGSGIAVRNKDGDDMEVRFENCTLHTVAQDPINMLSTPIYLEAERSMGAVVFDNVTVTDNRERPVLYGALRFPGADGSFFDIDGDITVVSPYGSDVKWNGPKGELGLNVTESDSAVIDYSQVVSHPDYQLPSLRAYIEPALHVSQICCKRPVANHLVNPSFEELEEPGVAANWLRRPLNRMDQIEAGAIKATGQAARTGDLGIAFSAAEGENYYIQQNAPVEEGKVYELSAWLKAVREEGGYARMKMEFWRVNADGSRQFRGEVTSETFHLWRFRDWELARMRAQAPADANHVGLLIRYYGPGEVYYDDVSFHEVDTP